MAEVKQIVVGTYQTNCYIVIDNGHAIIIDPGKKEERIIANIPSDITVDAICLTHGHFDHIQAVDKLHEYYHCPIYLDTDDEVLVKHCKYNQMDGYNGSIAYDTHPYDFPVTKINNFELEIIKASGHTEGSCLILYQNMMFAGDVIFKGSVGRTDLYLGNESNMKQSLKMIKTLDPNYVIYPGHGEITTLADELKYNYYLL